MRVNREQKRLKAIKLKYVLSPTECNCCGNEYKREKMWRLYRYGINKSYNKRYYCQNCMHSAKEVLNEVDTDECPFGLAGIDPFFCFKKKDRTRIDRAMDLAFGRKDQ